MTLPLSVIANEFRSIVEDESAHGHEFERVYGDFTLYGDVQYIYSHVKSAVDKREGEDHSINEYRADIESREQERPDLVEGHLEFAIERCEESKQKLEELDYNDDKYGLERKLDEAIEELNIHLEAAKNGKVLHN